MIVQRGVVVAAWGDVAHRSNLHSCRKSLLNSLIRIAGADGKINLDDILEKLGIDDEKPSLTAAEKQATVRDILEARSGVYHPTADDTKGMMGQKPARDSHPPGTFWYYNNWDFNTLLHPRAGGGREDLRCILSPDSTTDRNAGFSAARWASHRQCGLAFSGVPV
jgi:CubicO group peptidase (beta-lactamase class C family)